MMRNSSRKLPVLDICTYYKSPKVFVEELRSACHNGAGFFLLKHDLPTGLAAQQLQEVRDFFRQPLDKKMGISYESSPAFRGYMRMGVENTSGKVDLREQIELAAEYDDEAMKNSNNANNSHPPVYNRLCGLNQWPTQSRLKSTTMEYVQHVHRIGDCIRRSLCMALGLDPNSLDAIYGQDGDHKLGAAHWALKLIRYPPATASTDTEHDASSSSLGVGAHCDTNMITMVLQDEAGLQASWNNEWLDVPCDPNMQHLVVNLGEQAEILSRGYFLATPHRVLANESKEKERLSVAFFYNPMLSAKIAPLEHQATWERPQDHDHWRRKHNAMLPTVGDNSFKSLARSHPKVFSKHHGDLKLHDDGRIERRDEAA